MNTKLQRSQRREKRTRGKIKGSQTRPRLSVYRSNQSIYAQLIDDQKGITMLGLSEKHLENTKMSKKERAKSLGMLLAKKAHDKKIKTVVFDRGAYKYHGRVQAFAQGAREGGLQF